MRRKRDKSIPSLNLLPISCSSMFMVSLGHSRLKFPTPEPLNPPPSTGCAPGPSEQRLRLGPTPFQPEPLPKRVFTLLSQANIPDHLQCRQLLHGWTWPTSAGQPARVTRSLISRQSTGSVPRFAAPRHRSQVTLGNLAIMIFLLLCRVLQGHV